MAEIVAAFGVPHTPNFPALVAKQGPDCRTAQLYAQVAALLHDASPEVLVIYTDDHFNTFFLDNFPTFAVGIADQISGPNDQTAMPSYRVAGEASLASHVRARVIAAGFDLSLVQDFDLDHSIMVPLHFLTPDMNDSDRPGVHQWLGAAIAERAAVQCARPCGERRDRGLAGR